MERSLQACTEFHTCPYQSHDMQAKHSITTTKQEKTNKNNMTRNDNKIHVKSRKDAAKTNHPQSGLIKSV